MSHLMAGYRFYEIQQSFAKGRKRKSLEDSFPFQKALTRLASRKASVRFSLKQKGNYPCDRRASNISGQRQVIMSRMNM